MRYASRVSMILMLFLLTLAPARPSYSQLGYQFGRNKVQYRKFDWHIIRTPNFDIYYYDDEEEGARIAARLAERSYDMLSTRIGHEIDAKIPLILYASHNDFQQTNAIGGLIPEGVRGVTESLKRRVVLPMGGSMREFTHVLTHELVHAFQYDMFSIGPTGSSLRSIPPLWVMEGLAEYYSQGLDESTIGWLRDALETDNLPTIDELGRIQDIRVYKIGNAVWQYIGTTYGDDAVGRIFRGIPVTGGLFPALKKELEKDEKTLSQEFASWVEARFKWEGPPQEHTDLTQITEHGGFYYTLNAAPALSRDGKKLAFVSNRSLYNDIYVRDLTGDDEAKRIVKGSRSGELEVLRFLDTSLAWSADGRMLCFVAKAGKQDAIYLVDGSSGDVRRKITTGLNGLMSPDLSPDGRYVVFSGIDGGLSDLFMYDLQDDELIRVTNDIYTELNPRWSPNGSNIAFITDRGPRTDVDNLLFGDDNIAFYNFETGLIYLVVDSPVDESSPIWIDEGRTLLFTAGYEGEPAIYAYDTMDSTVTLHARTSPPVSAITRYTPSISGSDNGIAISAMNRGGWDIYLLPEMDDVYTDTIESVSRVEADSGLVDRLEQYSLSEGSEFQDDTYHVKFEPDYLVGGVGFSSNLGFQGGGALLISDMLGNHNFIVATRAYEDLGSSDIYISYQNMAHRINFMTSFFQFRNDYGLFTAPSGDEVEFQSQVYRGGGILAGYPLDVFRRIEFGGTFTVVNEKIVTQSFVTPGIIEVEEEDLGSAKYMTANAAFVYDNSIWGFTGPLSGRRARYSVEQAVGDLDYTTAIIDYRRYFNIKRRTLLAQRFIIAGSFGTNRQIFRIGGPYTYRGADYGELIGTRLFISNTEYRFPLLYFLGPQLDFFQGVFFWDMASVWYDEFRPFSASGPTGFHLEDLSAAFGSGLRFGMGYLVLKFDVAWETDLDSIPRNFTFFSIGTDY